MYPDAGGRVVMAHAPDPRLPHSVTVSVWATTVLACSTEPKAGPVEAVLPGESVPGALHPKATSAAEGAKTPKKTRKRVCRFDTRHSMGDRLSGPLRGDITNREHRDERAK
jgi:hypothetical protein